MSAELGSMELGDAELGSILAADSDDSGGSDDSGTDPTQQAHDSQSFIDDLMARVGRRTSGWNSSWFLEKMGAEIIVPTAFEPDARTYRGLYYYNAVTNILYRKIVSRNQDGIVAATWKKMSQ